MKILVLNSGSSSQKSCLYDIGKTLPAHPPAPTWEGKIEWNDDHADIQAQNSLGARLKNSVKVASRSDAIERLLDTLWSGELRVLSAPSEIDVVGHRVVHGGKSLQEATAITPEVKSAIARMSVFAPLHNRAELEGIKIIEKRIGTVFQVAVFDTGFHSRLPEPAAVYSGPYEWVAQGIRRYGFHGINHQYCSERTAQLLGRDLRSLKLVTCHLGNGCPWRPYAKGEASIRPWDSRP
jgi:acetate kinase